MTDYLLLLMLFDKLYIFKSSRKCEDQTKSNRNLQIQQEIQK